MATFLTCDATTCGQTIQDGTERYDITLPGRRDKPSGEFIDGARWNFHPTCYVAAGPVMPQPGITLVVSHIAATPPPADPAPAPADPAPAALPEPLRAPSA